MKSRIWTSICALVAILSLSACGGGGGGSGTASPTDDPAGGDNQGGGLGPVDGDFYFSSETEKFYQNPDADIFQEKCKQSDYYFESENFIVFSNLTTHSNDDLITAATKAQNAMDVILPKFGMNWDTFYAMKRVVSFKDLDQFASEVSQLTYNDGSGTKRLTIDQIAPEYFGGKMPDGYTDWQDPNSDPNLQYAFVYNTLINEDDPRTVRDVMVDAHEGYDQFFAANPTYEQLQADWNDQWAPFFKKIQICATSNDRVSRSSTSGFKIAPEFSGAVYRHEAAHLIINQLSKYPAFWAKEGQTHLFLGEDVPESVADVASIRDAYILGTESTEPGDENLDKFKKAYIELVETENVDIGKIMEWHQRSMNIKAEWLTDEGGTGEIISDAERTEGIKEAFRNVMPITYDAFFDNLANQ